MRLIDADALLAEAMADGAYGYVDAKQIADAPTIDAVPVVRCKDCKWWDSSTPDCDFHEWYRAEPRPDDFCSRGVKKDV